MKLTVAVGTAAVLALAAFGPANAAPNLVVNGGFESVTSNYVPPAGSPAVGTAQQLARTGTYNNTGDTVTGWVNTGYNFLFTPGSADTTGSFSPEFNSYLKLWGPNDGGTGGNATAGGPNALPAASPAGGNFIAADPVFEQGAISQTIQSALTVGAQYILTFYWAAAQQTPYTGITTESWQVTFGNSVYNTATVTTPSQGFTPWRQETVTFVANAATQVLSFLSMGTPAGVPPFALLDGVVLTAAPEPATWLIVIVGLGGLAFMQHRRRRSNHGGMTAA